MSKEYVSNFLVSNQRTVWVQDEEAQSDIADLNTRVGNINTALTAIDGRVSGIENTLNPETKNMIVVSDSYGLGRNDTEPWTTSFANYMTEYANVYNWSNGSMGIVYEGDGGYNALSYMQSKENEISDKNSVTDIVIAMGANDLLGYANFDQTFASLVSYINTTYPNAKIYLGMIGNKKDKTQSEYNAYCNVLTLYREACKNHPNCKYLNGVEYIMHMSMFFQSDGVHPTTNGSRWIGKGVAEAFRSGSHTVVARQIYNVSGISIEMTINGDTASIFFPDGNVPQKYFANRNYSSWFDITDPMLYVISGQPVIAQVSAFDNNGNRLPLSLKYAHGSVYLSTMQTAPVTMGAGGFYGCTITFPTIQA